MSTLCEKCPVRDVCLQAIMEVKCPIPTQPSAKSKHKDNKQLLSCATKFGQFLHNKIALVAQLHTGVQPSGKATVFDIVIRWFESNYPYQFQEEYSGLEVLIMAKCGSGKKKKSKGK